MVLIREHKGKLPRISIARRKSGFLFQGAEKQADAEIRLLFFPDFLNIL